MAYHGNVKNSVVSSGHIMRERCAQHDRLADLYMCMHAHIHIYRSHACAK